VRKSKAEQYFNEQIAPRVSRAAGVTIITAANITDVMRQNGSDGRTLNLDESLDRLASYLMDDRTTIELSIDKIDASIVFNANTPPTSEGLLAVVKRFASTHRGTFAVSVAEVGGAGRQANYNANKQFPIAAAGRVFYGYSLINSIEQDISISYGDDAACVAQVVRSFATSCLKLGIQNDLDARLHGIGFVDTVIGDDILSTTGDLRLFYQKLLDNRLLLNQSNHHNFIRLLSETTPRPGIRVGVDNLDAAGETNNVRTDAAVVYSADTTYILAIITDGGSWSDIAELANQIQSLLSRAL
jgi:hypothetical protein